MQGAPNVIEAVIAGASGLVDITGASLPTWNIAFRALTSTSPNATVQMTGAQFDNFGDIILCIPIPRC